MNLTHNMRQALIDLDAPYCDASVYWTKNTMAALEKRGLVFRRDNGITWSWEVTPDGRTLLKESGTSGCAACDDLKAENAALRDRVEALEWLVECEQTYRLCFLNVRYRHNLEPEKYEDVGDPAFHEMVDILIEAREGIK